MVYQLEYYEKNLVNSNDNKKEINVISFCYA